MSNINRKWHPNFVCYTEQIAEHPNYDGLYIERNKSGRLNWVVTGGSINGGIRKKWWEAKVAELGVVNMAEAARAIHPTKKHVCQCCGRSMSIYYEYPSKRTCAKLNTLLKTNISPADYTIREIISKYANDSLALDGISKIFNVTNYVDANGLISLIYKNCVWNNSSLLSPGVMSNPPDRFDGFHSDGLCCREKTDKGRHTDNMKTYRQDRRAYEEWADGDYNLANRIMAEFNNCDKKYICPICKKLRKMSADHIGPISIGFCHSIHNFAPMCKSCNSGKNNRFTKSDVDKLINIEAGGKRVISWHSEYLWNRLKHEITNDDDAKRLSSVMGTHHQNVLKLFSLIYDCTGEEFLKRYLNPGYSMFDYKFENFNPLDLNNIKIKKRSLNSVNKTKNSQRVLRVAFESLQEFDKKCNRRTQFYVDSSSVDYQAIIDNIANNDFISADNMLRNYIVELAQAIIDKEWCANSKAD